MSVQILLPKLGFAMSEATLSSWLVQDGAPVTQGQPLFALESNKAIEEIEAPASGTLRVIAQPGETYPVGTVLGEIA
jgi:pyruvate/2-oxoglutarate dehydrogenase complex dihydrolipoamide acyltransferase (E2) component